MASRQLKDDAVSILLSEPSVFRVSLEGYTFVAYHDKELSDERIHQLSDETGLFPPFNVAMKFSSEKRPDLTEYCIHGQPSSLTIQNKANIGFGFSAGDNQSPLLITAAHNHVNMPFDSLSVFTHQLTNLATPIDVIDSNGVHFGHVLSYIRNQVYDLCFVSTQQILVGGITLSDIEPEVNIPVEMRRLDGVTITGKIAGDRGWKNQEGESWRGIMVSWDGSTPQPGDSGLLLFETLDGERGLLGLLRGRVDAQQSCFVDLTNITEDLGLVDPTECNLCGHCALNLPPQYLQE